MAIPTVSNYPVSFDTDTNLYVVHDMLRLRLAEDYLAGDAVITVEDNITIMANFPPDGLITLTDQCSDIDERALSFHYGSRTDTTFNDLVLLPEFTDVSKPKKNTNVTLNVMAAHHNNIKDSLIAIEEFIGIKGTVDNRPYGDTMEGRINFLHRVALRPRAWFTVNKTIGIVPLVVEFKDLSQRVATGCPVGDVSYLWDFGDQTSSTISVFPVISVTDVVPTSDSNILVRDLNGGTIIKTYNTPGTFDGTLTISDDFGSSTVVFPNLINARYPVPEEAQIEISPTSDQELNDDILRTPMNSLIFLEVPSGELPGSDPSRSYAGEALDGIGNAIDPITAYTWALADDLNHDSSKEARASYGIGGLYDIVLRVDTLSKSFRITQRINAIDVIENQNLWLWTTPNSLYPNRVQAYEFGLISETFKVGSGQSLNISRNSSFLNGTNNSEQAIREFKRNNGFSPRSTVGSGSKSSTALIYWASGRDSSDSSALETVDYTTFNGFLDTYTTSASFSRPWNWASFNGPSNTHFFLGNKTGSIAPNTSPTNTEKTTLNLTGLTTSSVSFSTPNYSNGADELEENVATYVEGTIPDDGYFGVHRTAWLDSTGYLVRNSGVGLFFRLLNFYHTEGTFSNLFQSIRKQPDMSGIAKLEGQLVGISDSVIFFNNTGSISIWDTTDSLWRVGGPGVNATAFTNLQDSSVSGFANETNTLLGASDGDQQVYLSYDYSTKAFIKFNRTDLTFSTVTSRPEGEQWLMGVY